jgi:hypothetical protein
MLRYYMTVETRESVIAESNRLIAARAANSALRRQREASERPAQWPAREDVVAELGDERRLWAA